MIEQLLPTAVVAVDTRQELAEQASFAQERELVDGAVEKRLREFTTARACARIALSRLGLPPQPILSGERGEPLWPTGVVGSITHCDGYRACALARVDAALSIGIDAEPNKPLPDGVLASIALPEERPALDALRSEGHIHWDRLLFSAKESIYKAWFPLAKRWLGFEDALVRIDPGGSFTAQLLVEGPPLGGRPLVRFDGRWRVSDDLILTAVLVPPLPG